MRQYTGLTERIEAFNPLRGYTNEPYGTSA